MISSVTPQVSIIIATYNWSSALRCSMESALRQTFEDFELLVAGDGCSDDSRDVAMSFADSRVRWMNLPSNSGSQAAPNNQGIVNARGRYIAYLGHDDIWFPTHLEILMETMEREQADLAGAVTILFGPPESGVMGVSGVFANGEWSANDFLPPSSIVHKKSLIDVIGPWKDPWNLDLPTDVEFEKRAFAAGAKIVSTNQVTVFKFNAAWRRNAYRNRAAAEQNEILGRIRSGIDFRQELLVEAVRSVLNGKFIRITAPPPGSPGEYARHNARYKGSRKEHIELRAVENPIRFDAAGQMGGFEWHPPEPDEKYGSVRWSGPSKQSSLEFPVLRDRDLTMRIHIPWHFQQDLSRDLKITVDGEPVSWSMGDDCVLNVSLSAKPKDTESRPLQITLLAARTQRPLDLGINDDGRWLGVAVSWVEFSPVVMNPSDPASQLA